MGGADVIDQKMTSYRLDRKRKFRFYLRMFFDLIDIVIENSSTVYTKLGNSISLLDFNIVVAKSFPLSRTSKRKAHVGIQREAHAIQFFRRS